MRFHHFIQQPVKGLNQIFRIFRPFQGGIGVVILRHEFSLSRSNGSLNL